jgi:pyroglutamyl-peptidase
MAMPTNKILITAFEPFGDSLTNITQDILSALPCNIGKAEVIKQCLPVSFQHAPIALREIITEHNPNMLLLLGQCPDGENIRLERFAINMMDSHKADNDGYCPSEEQIYPDAPLAYRTPINIKTIANQLQEQQLPVAISNSTGLYVCNRVYYEALHLQQRATFIHIPKNFATQLATDIITTIAIGKF